MKHTKRMVAALVAAVALIGIVPMPALAVDPDCADDFVIPDSEPATPNSLSLLGEETGKILVAMNDVIDVRVELVSDGSVLDFGVFIDVVECEEASQSMSVTCDADESLSTEGATDPPQAQVCELEGGSSGSTYFFHFENAGLNTVSYKVWET